MTVQVIMEVALKDGGEQEFRDFMREIIADTRAYQGCVSIEFTRNQDSPNELLVMEKWDSRADYEKYLQWRMETGALTRMADAFDGQPKLRFFDPLGL